jgi:hypothetical protein
MTSISQLGLPTLSIATRSANNRIIPEVFGNGCQIEPTGLKITTRVVNSTVPVRVATCRRIFETQFFFHSPHPWPAWDRMEMVARTGLPGWKGGNFRLRSRLGKIGPLNGDSTVSFHWHLWRELEGWPKQIWSLEDRRRLAQRADPSREEIYEVL